MYRRGARRWRKLYRVNGHLFQAKRFSRVSTYIHTYVYCLPVGKGKVFPYSLPSVGPGADPDVQAVSPQVT